MRTIIDPGKERRSINFIDNIRYSTVQDRWGNTLDLTLSLMVQNGNSEMRLADGRDDEVSTGRQPVIVWINGAGWRGADKNLMAAEMMFLAEHGYAVACIYYRSSAQGVWPAQLIDCKTAVRFLRAHADQYCLDPSRIAAIGRSAGGHLASWMAMNTDGYDTAEWAGYSSHVQAAADMFGPTDISALTETTLQLIQNPEYRWHALPDTHEGALLDLRDNMSREEIFRRCAAASPINAINAGICPMIILHGDQDPLIPLAVSESFYNKLTEAGFEKQTEFYILKNGGHGTREFFQASTKKIIADFFDRYLRGTEKSL